MSNKAPPVDISKLSPQEQRLYKLYGKLPSRNELLTKKLKDRKFFDSGDYALSKAAEKHEPPPKSHSPPNLNTTSPAEASVGSKHPEPEDIPHNHLHVQASPPRSPHAGPANVLSGPTIMVGASATVREPSSLHEHE